MGNPVESAIEKSTIDPAMAIVKVPATDFRWFKIVQLGDFTTGPINPASPSAKAITSIPTHAAVGVLDQNRIRSRVILIP